MSPFWVIVNGLSGKSFLLSSRIRAITFFPGPVAGYGRQPAIAG